MFFAACHEDLVNSEFFQTFRVAAVCLFEINNGVKMNQLTLQLMTKNIKRGIS